jgi:hypothetical protein
MSQLEWRFMLLMEADGVMLNPVLGVRVRKESKKGRLGTWPAEDQGDSQAPA